MSDHREALKVVTSAWAVAFIVLFLAAVTYAEPHPTPEYADLTIALLVGAVFGAGWLWFRHKAKREAQ